MSHSNFQTNLQVGAYGWLHAHWRSSFYPDDLPQDWLLSYYSNEFNVVVVPADYWQTGVGYDCSEWLDDLSDDFRFYLECPETVLRHEKDFTLFIEQLTLLRSHLSAVVINDAFIAESEIKNQEEKLCLMSGYARLLTQVSADDVGGKVFQQSAYLSSIVGSGEQSCQLAVFENDLTNLRHTRVAIEDFAKKQVVASQQIIIVRHCALAAANLLKLRSVIEIMGL